MQTIRLLVLGLACLVARPVSALTVNSVITNGLLEPFSVAADTNDFYFITDTANHRILKYSPLSGVLTNFAGLIRNPGTSDGANYFARFNAPKGIIRVGTNLVVADTGNHLIRKVTSDGVVTRLAGTARGYFDGPAATARFNTPIGLAADAVGNLFIADTKNNAIRRLDTLGNVGTVSAEFNEPVGVAVSDDGRRIFVADTLTHSIKLVTTDWVTFTNVTRIAGSTEGISGANDSIFGAETLFNSPRGLLWIDDRAGLLVCDTGNQAIRRVFSNPDLSGIPGAEFSVETYAGVLSQPGFVNGPADVAKFNAPVWLARDSGGYLVADVTNSALRRIQVAEPQPAVSTPDIGWVDYVKDAFGERVTALQPVSWGRFFNDVTIAVRVNDPIGAVSTLFTMGPTFINRTNSAGVVEQVSNVENIPPPEEGPPVPEYQDGWLTSRQIIALISPHPDVTVKVRSIAGGRTPSPIKVARFQYLVATPQIIGDNPNSFVVLNQTIGATEYYTLDGTEPSPTNPSAKELVDPTNVSIPIGTSPVVFTVKGFKDGFQDSEIQKTTFVPENARYNSISFGFEKDEASSRFVGAVGQMFYAPVTLSLLPEQKIYTLQFNLGVTNSNPGVPPVSAGQVNFKSMLQQPIPGTDPVVYMPIDPQMFFFSSTSNSFLIPFLTNSMTTNLIMTNMMTTNIVVNYELTNIWATNIITDPVYGNQSVTNIFSESVVQSLSVVANFNPTPEYPFPFYTNYTYTTVWHTNFSTLLTSTNGYATNLVLTNAFVPVFYTNALFSSLIITNMTTNWYTTNLSVDFLDYSAGLTNLLMTNSPFNLLSVGWIERFGGTNLYDSRKQNLISFSLAHDNLFKGSDGKIIVGGFAFSVPLAAKLGDTYQIRIGRPSATYDGVSGDVFIDTPTNGSLAEGAINATKLVTVGSPEYIVGDVAPFRWLNAGDFGDTNLLNNDVVQVFQSAVYNVNTPPRKSDFFDAMDASDGTLTAVQDGNDKNIDNVKMGDGVLAVDDVFVVYRRSLDPTLKWYARYRDASGSLQSKEVPNLFRGRPMLPAETVVRARATAVSSDPPSARFFTDDFQVSPGQPVEVPIRVKVLGNWPLRVLMLNVAVRPLDNSPTLTQPVQFIPEPVFGQPFSTSSQGPNYAAVWLNPSVDGVLGPGVIGTLKFTVPATADAEAVYRIEFDHVSASPNGLSIFPQRLQAGLATLMNRLISSRGDGIPDAWRLRFFGSVSHRLAEAMADADGDGVPNWAEFRAGTDPTDFRSLLRMLACGVKANPNSQQPPFPVLRWPSVDGKKYMLEVSPALAVPQWSSISSELLGTGGDMDYTDTQANGRVQFYRVRLVE